MSDTVNSTISEASNIIIGEGAWAALALLLLLFVVVGIVFILKWQRKMHSDTIRKMGDSNRESLKSVSDNARSLLEMVQKMVTQDTEIMRIIQNTILNIQTEIGTIKTDYQRVTDLINSCNVEFASEFVKLQTVIDLLKTINKKEQIPCPFNSIDGRKSVIEDITKQIKN